MQRGIHATFMPKPLAEHWGSGMHTHLSLFDGDVNAFHDADDEYHLSPIAKQFMAGLLVHAREITAVCCQWVNSYKRLVPGRPPQPFEAPVHVGWGRQNRSALIRVPMYKPKKGASTRLEFRSPDPACNPYLMLSVVLAAGLKGIEEGYELAPEVTDNIHELSETERRKAGIQSLPRNLDEALGLMEDSELVAAALGDHLFEYFLRNKRVEWDAYRAQVTPWELATYLPTL